MPSPTEDQSAFVAALLDPERAVPQGLTSRTGPRPAKRFNVYRNNVFVSLIDALQGRYPAVCRLVGEEFFRAMARPYVQQHPPRSPVLLRYGGGFADFLEEFEPVAELPYLADVARLEWAWNNAYHAADVTPLGADDLAHLATADIAGASFTLHPSLGLVASPFPVVTLWTTMTEEGDIEELTLDRSEDALVLRPQLEVVVRELPAGAVTFISQLHDGNTLQVAAAAAAEENSEFDLSVNLAGLIQSGAICGVDMPGGEDAASSDKELNHV